MTVLLLHPAARMTLPTVERYAELTLASANDSSSSEGQASMTINHTSTERHSERFQYEIRIIFFRNK